MLALSHTPHPAYEKHTLAVQVPREGDLIGVRPNATSNHLAERRGAPWQPDHVTHMCMSA